MFRSERNRRSCDNVLFGSCEFGVSDCNQLLSYHGKYFDIYPVEFVEATPGTGSCQAGEEPAHHLRGKRDSLILFPVEIICQSVV